VDLADPLILKPHEFVLLFSKAFYLVLSQFEAGWDETLALPLKQNVEFVRVVVESENELV
jgi:hypothetical protein